MRPNTGRPIQGAPIGRQEPTREIFEAIDPKMKVFSGIDLKAAFYQCTVVDNTKDFLSFVSHPVEVKEKIDIEKTNGERTVVEPGTYFQWTHARLPMGLLHSPGVFSTALATTLKKHMLEYYGSKVLQFADDVIVLIEDY